MTDTDRKYMRMAIELARRGKGTTNPNPLVGAVIVKDGRIIGQGYHERCGQPHAERNALASCVEDPAGATIYVTLEPCNHYGKTPPCTQALIQARISRVFIGSPDPNPKAAGGIQVLRDAGIEVIENFLREECDALNPVFFKYINEKLPYVTMKYAMSLDGKIACKNGASQWITSGEARLHTHRLRAEHMGILVGMGTVLEDDPLLTCRIGGMSPIRIICDTHLRTPLSSQLVQTAKETGELLRQPRTIIATCERDPQKTLPYEEAGVTILQTAIHDGHVDLRDLMEQLAMRSIDSVLIEGGGEVNWSALRAGLCDKVFAYTAPKILGVAGAKSPVSGQGVESPDDAFYLDNVTFRNIGADLLIEGEVRKCSQE